MISLQYCPRSRNSIEPSRGVKPIEVASAVEAMPALIVPMVRPDNSINLDIKFGAGQLRRVAESQILSGLDFSPLGRSALDRIFSANCADNFDFVFDIQRNRVLVWPHMRAAAKFKDKHFTGRGTEIFAIALNSSNPWKFKTFSEIRCILLERGWRETETGRGRAFVPPENSKVLIAGIHLDYGSVGRKGLVEPAHVEYYYRGKVISTISADKEIRGERPTLPTGEVFKSKKFPLDPTDPNWRRMRENFARQQTLREALGHRDAAARADVPTMTHAGVELTLRPLPDFEPTPDMTLLVPLGPGEISFSDLELNQLMQELFVGMVLCGENPTYSLDPLPDATAQTCLPPAYQNTLVGRVLAEVDILGKSALMGLLMPQPTRRAVAAHLSARPLPRSGLSKDDCQSLFDLYCEHGAEPLRHHETFGNALRDAAAKANLAQHHGGIIGETFVFSVDHRSFAQEDDLVVFDCDLQILTKAKHRPRCAENAQVKAWHEDATAASTAALQALLTEHPSTRYWVELLKITAMMAQLLRTLQQGDQPLIPDLKRMDNLTALVDHEEDIPPFIAVSAAGSPSPVHNLFGATQLGAGRTQRQDLPEPTRHWFAARKQADNRPKTAEVVTIADKRYIALRLPLLRTDARENAPAWLWDLKRELTQPPKVDAAAARLELQTQLQKGLAGVMDVGNSDAELVAAVARVGSIPLMEQLQAQVLPGTLVSLLKQADAAGRSPMHAAIDSGSLEMVQLLLRLDADAYASTGPLGPIVWAGLQGRADMVAALTAGRGSLPTTGPHVLQVAVALDDLDGARAALQADPAALERVDPLGYRPLLRGIQGLNAALVALLLENGADVRATGPDGLGPLHVLCREALPGEVGTLAIAQQLLRAKAPLDVGDANGWTPLHWAAQRNLADLYVLLRRGDGIQRSSILEMLVGADGHTAAGLAARWGCLEVLQRRQGRASSLDGAHDLSTGRNLAHLAALSGHPDTLRWLGEQAPHLFLGRCQAGDAPLACADTEDAAALCRRFAAVATRLPPRPQPACGPKGLGAAYAGQRHAASDLPMGFGTYEDKDLGTYHGGWFDGMVHGPGSLKAKTGEFEGTTYFGRRHGPGQLRLPGLTLQGAWYAGALHGQGSAVFANGDRYQGGFVGNLFHGHGRYDWQDGGHYVGDWRQQRPEGLGTWTCADGTAVTGTWRDDALVGRHTIIWANGEQEVREKSCSAMPAPVAANPVPTSLARWQAPTFIGKTTYPEMVSAALTHSLTLDPRPTALPSPSVRLDQSYAERLIRGHGLDAIQGLAPTSNLTNAKWRTLVAGQGIILLAEALTLSGPMDTALRMVRNRITRDSARCIMKNDRYLSQMAQLSCYLESTLGTTLERCPDLWLRRQRWPVGPNICENIAEMPRPSGLLRLTLGCFGALTVSEILFGARRRILRQPYTWGLVTGTVSLAAVGPMWLGLRRLSEGYDAHTAPYAGQGDLYKRICGLDFWPTWPDKDMGYVKNACGYAESYLVHCGPYSCDTMISVIQGRWNVMAVIWYLAIGLRLGAEALVALHLHWTLQQYRRRRMVSAPHTSGNGLFSRLIVDPWREIVRQATLVQRSMQNLEL